MFAEEEVALILDEAADADSVERMMRRRVTGEPLEIVLGWARFRGLRIAVDTGVFVPRTRTGHLVELALPLLTPGGLVLDLCCGSGAAAAAVEAESGVDGLEVWAADVDPAAVRCARRNIRGTVVEGDLFAALPPRLRGGFGVILVNAPYVPSGEIRMMPPEARLHEPRAALDGGYDGVDVHRRIATDAVDWILPGGTLLIETSAQQEHLTLEAFDAAGWTAHVTRSDALEATAVVATSPAPGR